MNAEKETRLINIEDFTIERRDDGTDGLIVEGYAAVFNSTADIGGYFEEYEMYCDFSGYSDIALGTAKLFGVNLMQNFKSPYFSSTVKELWSRWHISLSTWFRDYVYIPLGGNRVSKFRHKMNLIITFLVSGLWHGANWNFVIWGGLHGVAQAAESVFLPKNKKTSTVGKHIRNPFVFAFTCFAWIFFRAQTFSEAMLKALWQVSP